MGFGNFGEGTFKFGDGSWLAPLMKDNDNDLEAIIKRFFVLEQVSNNSEDWIDHGRLSYIGQAQEYWRTFLKNNENDDFTFKYDGSYYTMDANTSYACHRQEASFILQKAMEADMDVTEVDIEEFKNSGDEDPFLS